jgi:hypothetical protein
MWRNFEFLSHFRQCAQYGYGGGAGASVLNNCQVLENLVTTFLIPAALLMSLPQSHH